MADISKITLPSGNTYDIKDAVARQMISGGVTFIIAWDGTSTPVVADIPEGVKVTYNSTEYTGTLTAETSGVDPHAQAGAFYLVKSSTLPSSETLDIYDEYVPAGTTGSKFWEKIGDTKIDLSDVVTDVSLSKQTDTVIGTDATFTITQPTVALAAESSSATGRAEYIQSVSTNKIKGTASGTAVTPSTANIKATASGGGASWNSKDSKTVVTGYTIAAANKDTFVKSVSAETNKNLVTTSITPTNGTETVSKVTKTASKLATTTVPNVTSAGSASTWSFTMGTGTGNTETLVISGANSTAPTLGTAKTVATGSVDSNGSGADVVTGVTVSDKTVAKAGSAVTVATGSTSTTGTGDPVVTGVTVGDSADAIVSLPSPSTASVIGASSTFTNTQPTVKLETGGTAGATGVVTVATGISSVTQPTIALATDANGDVTVVTSAATKYMKATASGANTAWNSKDSVTVLKNTTDVSVTKGNA